MLKEIFENSINHKPSLGHVMSRRFSRFDVYWTKTDKQTDDKQSIYIDMDKMSFSIYIKTYLQKHSGIKIEKLFRNMKNLYSTKINKQFLKYV